MQIAVANSKLNYMKKLLFVIAIFISTTTFAQVQVGVKGGVNASNFSGKDLEGYKKEGLIGFHVGGYVDIPVSGIFSIKPEVVWSTQGAKLENATGGETDYKLNYINVPVLAKFDLGAAYIEVGPQFGFKAGEDIGNTTINDFAKNLDLSGAIGLGINSGRGFGIAARYFAGLSKVSDFEFGSTKPDYKHSVFQLSLTYNFLSR